MKEGGKCVRPALCICRQLSRLRRMRPSAGLLAWETRCTPAPPCSASSARRHARDNRTGEVGMSRAARAPAIPTRGPLGYSLLYFAQRLASTTFTMIRTGVRVLRTTGPAARRGLAVAAARPLQLARPLPRRPQPQVYPYSSAATAATPTQPAAKDPSNPNNLLTPEECKHFPCMRRADRRRGAPHGPR